MADSGRKVKRRSAPKVKSGCKTCKVRRIKCDEDRPACTNCSNSGRVCDGYPPSFEFRAVIINPRSKTAPATFLTTKPVPRTWTATEKRQSSDSGNENYLLVGTTLWQPEILPGNAQEQQFFLTYRQNLAPALGGYFDTEFWNTQLPRVAYSKPAVYHAIIAIAALDHDDASGPDALGPEEQVLFLVHYNKAIHFVTHQIQDEGNSQLVILITCLLFICLEFKRGNNDVALKHLQSGLSILHSQNPNHELSEVSDISETLSRVFSRLSIQGSLVGQQPPPGSPHALNASQIVHVPFANIGEARSHLMALFIEGLRPNGPDFTFEASFSTLSSDQARRATLVSQLHQWNSQLGLFMTDKLSSLNSQDMRMIRLLRIQSLIGIIWNSTTIPSSHGSSIEPAFDAYTDMFQTLLSLAAFFIEDPPTRTSSKTSSSASTPSIQSSCLTPLRTSTCRSSFSFEMGLIFSLYFVAIKCRSPTLRRQAAHFLSRVEPCREGMWDARVLEKIAQRVILLEETGCVEKITEDLRTWPPDESRVHGVYIFPRCDYVNRVQRITLFWRPIHWMGTEGYEELGEEIRF